MGYNKERYKTLKITAYYILFCLWYVVSLLPMWVLYGFSSLISVILYHVVKYRRDVIRQNLQDSFPNLSLHRRQLIERRFYTHFCDLLIESLKYISISPKEMKRRFVFKGVDRIKESCHNGRSCGVFIGHYANWEWISSIPLWVDPKESLVTQMYHPLENLVMDKLICYTRSRFGGVNVPVDFCIRHIIDCRRQGKPLIMGFIADQAPYWTNIHLWAPFLNHPETPFFTGAERLIKKFDMDVYYLDVRRVRRGHYVAEFKLMTDKPKEYPDWQLTEWYAQMLERTISRAPSYWLWSHRRWKRTKEEWERDWKPKTE